MYQLCCRALFVSQTAKGKTTFQGRDPSNYACEGGDLAILFLNQVISGSEGQLNTTGLDWVAALKSSFTFRSLTDEERSATELAHNLVNVKSGPMQ